MDKTAAIRVLPGTIVAFRGRRHEVISTKGGAESEAPYFRLRATDDGAMTGLISHRLVEPEPDKTPRD
jgi:hypothetical protein